MSIRQLTCYHIQVSSIELPVGNSLCQESCLAGPYSRADASRIQTTYRWPQTSHIAGATPSFRRYNHNPGLREISRFVSNSTVCPSQRAPVATGHGSFYTNTHLPGRTSRFCGSLTLSSDDVACKLQDNSSYSYTHFASATFVRVKFSNGLRASV